ncbi:DUF3238 domain-containing protein [Ornithinibacillus bavariensis]|uniref:DUF3238 domain-containing protein n=1 Tax=Ornithinibacillus bavariensis TaxID=545502 RepID=UPI000ECE1DE7|nr:hypothetical protein [Ornithinibacillus sp.]
MRKILSLLVAVLSISLFFGSAVGAETNSKIVSKETSNSISLEWFMDGDYYKVYRNQELVWEGKETNFVDTNLESDHMYNYRIGTYNSQNDLIEITNLKTRTEPINTKRANILNESNPLDSGKLNNILTTEVGSDYVRLTWSPMEDEDGVYEIYRNDILIGSTKELTFLDLDVDPDQEYQYTIQSATIISEEERKPIDDYIKENNLVLTDEQRKEVYTQPHVLIRTIQTNKENPSEEELTSKDLPKSLTTRLKQSELNRMFRSSTSSMNYTILFRYTTFIPEARAENPLNSTVYGGDNRSFDFYADAYRTRSDVFAGWLMGQELYQNPYTGVTVQYKNGEVNTKKASTSGIKLTKDLVSSSKMMWRVNHNVGNPFSSLFPGLTYYYEGTLYNTYDIELRGSHDKAPNHEFYYAVAYTDFVTPGVIFKYTGGGLYYLIPGMPQQYFEFSI